MTFCFTVLSNWCHTTTAAASVAISLGIHAIIIIFSSLPLSLLGFFSFFCFPFVHGSCLDACSVLILLSLSLLLLFSCSVCFFFCFPLCQWKLWSLLGANSLVSLFSSSFLTQFVCLVFLFFLVFLLSMEAVWMLARCQFCHLFSSSFLAWFVCLFVCFFFIFINLLFSFCPWKLFGYSLSNFSIDPYLAASLLATMVLQSYFYI